MQTDHITYSSQKELLKSIKKIQKISYKSLLVQIYSGHSDTKKLQKIIKTIKKELSNVFIIGASTAGEIVNAKVNEKSISLGFTTFSNTKIKLAYSKNTDKKSAQKLIKKIDSKNIKAIILLSNGLSGNHQEFLQEFNSYNKDVIISGGLAGDNFELKKTYIIVDDKIYNDGSLALSFNSKDLYADNKYILSWHPIGKEMTVTKADGATIYEIDNRPAALVYEKYLGKNIFKNLPQSLLEFQLLFEEGNTTIARTPMAREKDALIFAAPVNEGQKVQFGFSNAQSLLSKASALQNQLSNKPAEAIFVFSCVARKALLQEYLEKEMQFFENVAPTIGFITYGEYYKTESSNALLNCTTTLLVLSEEKSKRKQKKKANYKFNDFEFGKNTFDSLLYFIKQTTEELDDQILLLDQYKKAVDSSLLVSKTDIKGNITYINDNFTKISGYSKKELLGKPHNIVRHSNSSKKVFKDMWKVISSGEMWSGILENRAKDGTSYFVDATILPIFDNDKIVEYMALRQDITKQVVNQRKIKDNATAFRVIFNNQDAILIYASREDGIININQTFFNMFDYSSTAEFKKAHSCICDLFIEQEGYIYKSERTDWLDFVANNPEERHKVKMKDKFGSIRTFLLKVNTFDDKFVVNITDITDLEEALLKAYMSEHAKSMFVANMSHEIRTPLNGILGFTDILLKSDLAQKDKKHLEIIHKSGETLLGIVNDILDMAKIESGQMQISAEDINISKEIESVISIFSAKAKEKKLEYTVFIDPNIPRVVRCDAQRIKQVLSNLISNAIKFTHQQKEIKVDVKIKETLDTKILFHVSVIDEGIGIAKDKMSSVFESFTQADNSISREYGGTGLGLPISARFIEMMGGTIKVNSTVGYGSEFYFDIWLDVIENEAYINSNNQFKDLKIHILESLHSQMYEILNSYLSAWNIPSTVIKNIDELTIDADAIFLFSDNTNENEIDAITQKSPNAKLFCLDSNQKTVCFTNKKVLHIEQPLTGSALYDALVNSFANESFEFKSAQSNEINLYNAHVLIAEDNMVNQLLVSTLLEEREITYDIANNGEEAVNLAQLNSYDLVLMDINMPIQDGLSATRELRELDYKVPIIALTANVIESDKMEYVDSGMQNHLAKPIDVVAFDSVLNQYLHIKKEIDNVKFDDVSVELAIKNIGIKNEKAIVKLLSHFYTSVVNIKKDLVESIEIKNFDRIGDLVHQLKGMVGNMHFKETFKTIVKVEELLLNPKIEVLEKEDSLNILLNQLQDLIVKTKKIRDN